MCGMILHMKKSAVTIFWVVLILLIVGGFGWTMYAKTLPGKYDTLAQCLGEKGAKFYGAFWCPHCQEQKKMFGNSAKLLPYIECSTPDGKGQTQECIDKQIQSYPTWEFADGSRVNGEQKPQVLADKTGCPLQE